MSTALQMAARGRGGSRGSCSVSTGSTASTASLSGGEVDGLHCVGGAEKRAAVLDRKEEDGAIQLALANRTYLQHEQRTKLLLTSIAVVVVVGAILVLSGTAWQQSLLNQYEDDYAALAMASGTGHAGVELLRTGFMRVFAENGNDPYDAVDTQFAAEWRALYDRAQGEFRSSTDELIAFTEARYDQELVTRTREATSAYRSLQVLFNSTEPYLGAGDSSEAMHILDNGEVALSALSAEAIMDEVTALVDVKAQDRRQSLLRINVASIALTSAALVGILLTSALVAWRLSTQELLHERVFKALRKCEDLDQQWEVVDRQRKRSRSTHDTGGAPRISISDDPVAKETEEDRKTSDTAESDATQKLRKAAWRVRVSFVLLMVLCLASFGSIIVSLALTRNALGNANVFHFLAQWFKGPTTSAQMSAYQWVGMYSSLLLPGMRWIERKVSMIPDVAFQLETVSCGIGRDDPNSVRSTIMDVCDILAQFDEKPECILDHIPDELEATSLEVYTRGIDLFQAETLAIVYAFPDLLFPQDRTDPEVVDFLGDTGTGTLTCFECENFYKRHEECSDPYLEFLFERRAANSTIVSQARTTMRTQPLNSTRQIKDSAQPFLQDLEMQNEREIDKVSSALVVSLAVVSSSVVLIVIISIALWKQEEEREKRAASVRQEEEWSLYRILHHSLTFDLFLTFAKESLAGESPLFWKRCQQAKKSHWPAWMCVELFLEFILPGAQSEININNQCRDAIVSVMQPYIKDDSKRNHPMLREEWKTISRAQKDIYELMSVNFYSKFLKSDAFQEFIAERNRLVEERMSIMQGLTSPR